jgi:hypothetical protein
VAATITLRNIASEKGWLAPSCCRLGAGRARTLRSPHEITAAITTSVTPAIRTAAGLPSKCLTPSRHEDDGGQACDHEHNGETKLWERIAR